MSLIHNERLKLLATYLNGLAIATFAIGGLAPILAGFYGPIQNASALAVSLMSLVCFVASAALHYAGRKVLEGLRP